MESKQRLPRDVLEGGAERPLTEMKDDEILDVVALDVRAASARGVSGALRLSPHVRSTPGSGGFSVSYHSHKPGQRAKEEKCLPAMWLLHFGR
jgi:hypothetical protein